MLISVIAPQKNPVPDPVQIRYWDNCLTLFSRTRLPVGPVSSSRVSAVGPFRVSGSIRPRHPAERPLREKTVKGTEEWRTRWDTQEDKGEVGNIHLWWILGLTSVPETSIYNRYLPILQIVLRWSELITFKKWHLSIWYIQTKLLHISYRKMYRLVTKNKINMRIINDFLYQIILP